MMLQLDEEQRGGFRLQALEIYNWGTFNGRVWKIEPGGSTALLTGANGSGKSTLVDALLTLLVPSRRRSYNQASGSEKRGERDEKSYVRGAYGRVRDEETLRGVVKNLRTTSDYSVLLAAFANEQLDQQVTLAQLFYWKDDALARHYMVAQRRLTIVDDLQIATTPSDLLKGLKRSEVDVSDSFQHYSQKIIKLFRLRSEKALDLFNQTVSLKEIGGLNDFVRQHMLEKTDVAEKIGQLRETYQNLTSAHDAIAKAERQIALLAPLLADSEQRAQLLGRIHEAERCAAVAPAFFAQRRRDLIDRELRRLQGELDAHQNIAEQLRARLEDLRHQELDLNAAITNDRVGQQIEQLRRDGQHVSQRMMEKKKRAKEYDDLAHKLTLPLYTDHPTFVENLRKAQDAIAPVERRIGAIVGERDTLKQREGQLLGSIAKLRDEIESLRQRRSRIPSELVALRERMAQALRIDEGDLPFVGELLKVREVSRPWEGAIERLLHGYGCQMLVAERHYRTVVGYVESTNLRGRLVFLRADPQRTTRSVPPGPDSLFAQLEVKPDADLHDWLRADLIDGWDYVCCADLEQFQRERRALTIGGQIKHGGARHEKDDRRRLGDPASYVLGWDNRETIEALEREQATEQAALHSVQDAISALDFERDHLSGKRDLLHALVSKADFAAIDWHAEEQRGRELSAQIAELEASSDRLAKLHAQLAEVRALIKAADTDLQRALMVAASYQAQQGAFGKQRAKCDAMLAQAPEDLALLAPQIEADQRERPFSLDNADEVLRQVEQSYNNRANSLRGQAGSLENAMIGRMTNFKRDYPEDTSDMDGTLESLDEYRRMHERLLGDDLPAHRKRFKAWLDDKVITAIVAFQSVLEKQVSEYRESIAVLNESLRTIAYTSATYILLTADANRDVDIQGFRSALRSCIPDVGQRSAETNELSFQRIRALIDRFDKEERWAAKVTDVRNWLDFAAEERYEADGAVKNYYSDSSGKSGGQKAKLAYTILASAIAYQYGLDQDAQQRNTFRFVVVDEAFSKSDETNARYAMNLFRQLNLQLLVVTPLDKTHVVEPYIAACHFVANTQEENDSRVINMTIAQYQQQKAIFASLGEAPDAYA